MAFRGNLAKLRGLANEKGYRLEKAPISGTWFLVNEETGETAMSDRGTTAFSVERGDQVSVEVNLADLTRADQLLAQSRMRVRRRFR